MNSSLNSISLFSGCGGDTLGLTRAGFHVAAFNEFNKAAIQSHEANFSTSILLKDPVSNATDITKVPDSVFEPYKGTTKIVFAGFPCQGFSKAGKKKATDPRNQMFRQFVRVVKVTKPDFVIGENVVGLTTMKSGPNETDPLMLDIIKKAFQDIGYEMTHKVLEATEFGVPQKRKRILLIGWDVSRYPTFDPSSFWASVANWGANQQIPILRSFVKPVLTDAYELKVDEVPEDFDTYALTTSDTVSGTPHPFVVLKAGEKLLSCSKRVSPIHSEVIDLNKPSKTIICTYDHQPRLLVGLKHQDGRRFVRTLLPDELQQIQGFPSDYKVLGNKKELVVQIGNAVPPNLVQSVSTVLRSYMEPVFETVPVEVKKRVGRKKSTKS
ncbi:MAG: DNA (cytosine-5-)-methyltransferase [Flavobacteriia bacterium]|nr:DNA (cytosine-5-)-methyltransferase [Flavobacteriia bacterium]